MNINKSFILILNIHMLWISELFNYKDKLKFIRYINFFQLYVYIQQCSCVLL